jgi:hypothetical protein
MYLIIFHIGIEIISVRVTKPIIPEKIKKNFEDIEAEKTKLQLAIQTQKITEKQAETKRREATILAEGEFEVSAIKFRQQVAERETT